jgi:GrpB-like predicted nucleotidyltransferase (UPF0157 family)
VSRAVVVEDYRTHWAAEFTCLARRIRALVGPAAIRIDHIGSTAVPGLGAKDVIDLQITVGDLDRVDAATSPLRAAGFRQEAEFGYDVFTGKGATDLELRKVFLREPEGERRAHIHVREIGRFNQRYALLFRDYLRAAEDARAAYGQLKREAARIYPDSIDGYLLLKDPVFHIVYAAASLWADKVGWRPGDDHL